MLEAVCEISEALALIISKIHVNSTFVICIECPVVNIALHLKQHRFFLELLAGTGIAAIVQAGAHIRAHVALDEVRRDFVEVLGEAEEFCHDEG